MTPTARPRSATGRTRHYRRNLLSILVFGLVLSGCVTLTGGAPGTDRAAAEFTFDQSEVITGSATRQTVLTGFLLGGALPSGGGMK
jgi:hypothetical protein